MAEGKDKFDINNDQKLKKNNLDKDDGTIAKTEMHEGYDHEQYNKLDRGQLEDPISEPTADGVIFPGNDSIYDTEDRADADFRPGNENFDINNDQKIAFDKSDGPGPDGVSGDVVNMADMHSQKDDAAEHQAPKGPPQDPQGMGLDRLGTNKFDEDGMGDMHGPDDPNDGGEVV